MAITLYKKGDIIVFKENDRRSNYVLAGRKAQVENDTNEFSTHLEVRLLHPVTEVPQRSITVLDI